MRFYQSCVRFYQSFMKFHQSFMRFYQSFMKFYQSFIKEILSHFHDILRKLHEGSIKVSQDCMIFYDILSKIHEILSKHYVFTRSKCLIFTRSYNSEERVNRYSNNLTFIFFRKN